MTGGLDTDWRSRYAALTPALHYAASARAAEISCPDLPGMFLCGMSAVVDARVTVQDLTPLADAAAGSRARTLYDALMTRVSAGIGGEMKFDWPDGPAWLRARLPVRHSLGGTGPQAAWVLSALGFRTLIALEDRNDLMLHQIPPGVLIAQGEDLVAGNRVVPSMNDVPETFIFEFTAGKSVGDIVPRRSSRTIVRFIDRGLQDDQDFDHLSVRLAATASAGLLAGLNDVMTESLPAACDKIFELARSWRSKGLRTVHFELAGYVSKAALDRVLQGLRGAVTSVGMSHSELLVLYRESTNPMEAMATLAGILQVERLCVHADTWAAAVTRGDPVREQRALMAGCAIASARAAAGVPVEMVAVSPDAVFEPLPFAEHIQAGKWTFVACSAPYLQKPTTTLGLGDSFTAGCLLVLGREAQDSSSFQVKKAETKFT